MPDPETPRYRALECRFSGHWIVETQLPCINGLAAWVTVADCGSPEPSDEMCGYDPREWAERIARSLEASSPCPI